MPCETRSAPRFRALPGKSCRSATWCCLALCLTACAAPPRVQLVSAPIDPPPPELAEPCAEGPPIPVGDTRLAEALEVWQARESAAAACRDRHARLVKAWPR